VLSVLHLTSQNSQPVFMKQRNWFKPKAFTHLTAKLSLSDAKWVKEYVADVSKVAKHKFYPLIHRTIVTKRFKTGIGINNELIKKHYTYKNGNKQSTAKYREIYYANHLDSHIYAYYAQRILEPLYEEKLRENAQLNESVIAYRRISLSDNSRCKCNIDFANEVFDLIKLMKGETAVIALDTRSQKIKDSMGKTFK
jgi:hypothetical protein